MFKDYSGHGPNEIHEGIRGAARHYQTMDFEAICNIPVCNLVKDDAVLFLWAYWPMLPQALELIDRWGFTYKTEAWVWAKRNKKSPGWHMGLGFHTRANTEVCLLATRGKGLTRVDKGVLALIEAPVRAHSQKPDEQYELIDRLYGPNMRKLELFARERHPGWDVWGNEVDSDIDFSTIVDGDFMRHSK